MSRRILTLVALASLVPGCADRVPTTPEKGAGTGGNARARPERLARALALGLQNYAFRTFVSAQLRASPVPERKLQFQRFLKTAGGRALRVMAQASGVTVDDLERDGGALGLELYLPVPAHREAWRGDENVLVATALDDHEAPIAFDVKGRRYTLSPDEPPATPVLALVPLETDFAAMATCIECDGGGGGGTGGGGGEDGEGPPAAPGLYMTRAHFVKDFEGWLKGNPEFEVHILGQRGTTDSLAQLQCAGEHAGGPYTFDQNDADWTGNVLLFSQTQIDRYNAEHPGQNFRVFVVEDDDTACQIKVDADRANAALRELERLFPGLTGGNDSSSTIGRWYRRANAAQKIFRAFVSLILTNDEFVGNAIEDVVVGAYYPGYNWFVKGEHTVTNGWIELVMR